MENIIREKLSEIEEKENIRIIAAVESGSRAWGFASPDSDYDVRFIYVRPFEDYLRLERTSDVIEWQLDDVLDINGWDLKKALQLMYDSNPAIFEWCASPIIYRNSEAFEELKSIRYEYLSRKKLLYHYWHMSSHNYKTYLSVEPVKLKKYFYVIRPLLATKWLIDKKTQPPMEFSKLVESELPTELLPVVNKMLAMKEQTSELGLTCKVKELDDFIENEYEIIKEVADSIEYKKPGWKLLDTYFVSQVKKVANENSDSGKHWFKD